MNIRYFDAHTDTILKVKRDNLNLKSNPYHVSIDKLKGYHSPVITLAVFNGGNFFKEDIISHIQFIRNQCEKYSSHVHYGIDESEKKISFISSIEGLGNTPDVTPDDIALFCDMGVKFISLTWNQDTFLSGGIENNLSGITQKGKDILKAMEKTSLILDVSHISDQGFYDCMEHYNGKICATHSNSRYICPHNRNLTDDQFKNLMAKNGVCGINLYPTFINSSKNATLDDVIRHIEHFLSLGGEDNIGIGTDFDGIDFTLIEIPDCSRVYRLFDRLTQMNYPYRIIQKISYKNFLNLINF